METFQEKPKWAMDVGVVRQHAERGMKRGAVTDDYPLDLKEAYELLNSALASEILCVLRYRDHQIAAKGIDSLQIAEEFAEHAINEGVHMMKLAERIDQLGGKANFDPNGVAQRAVTQFGEADDLVGMIREDLVAERTVIEVYRKMIRWFAEGDPTTRRLLEDILADEEEHANDLADLLGEGSSERATIRSA